MGRWSYPLPAGNGTTAGLRSLGGRSIGRVGLDRVADGAQDLADLAAQEDQGDDRDDRDEREDQRVFRETLAILVTAEDFRRAKIERGEERHVGASWMSTHPRSRAAPLYGRTQPLETETLVPSFAPMHRYSPQPPVARSMATAIAVSASDTVPPKTTSHTVVRRAVNASIRPYSTRP